MLRYLLFTFLPLFSMAQSVDPNNALLWEISGNGLEQPSYVFGTYHSNDSRLFNFSDSTYFALNNADMISLETDVFSMADTWDVRMNSLKIKYDNEGNPYVSDPNATETIYGDEDGRPQFLDAYFQQYCYNAEKEFYPLETVDFQQNLLIDWGIPDFRRVNLSSFLMSKDLMIETYLKGDIYKLDEMLRGSLAMYTQGYKKLIIDRNVDMADQIIELIPENRLFCAVGAGHLPGTGGVLNLLRKAGYTIRKVTASYSDEMIEEKREVLSVRNYVYSNDLLGMTIEFPGKPKVIEQDNDDAEVRLSYRDFGQGNTYEVQVYRRGSEIGLKDLAQMYIPSPSESPFAKIELQNGGEAYEGIADSYPEGIYWTRIIMSEDYFVIMKAYGGNKFMNSQRAQKFFDRVQFQ
ncbi:MAG: TraB/GumN family protein [Crocinitomicaceae bacterium]|nr:TraB/GumN family protein [Crocinitomicaceae bacterium]